MSMVCPTYVSEIAPKEIIVTEPKTTSYMRSAESRGVAM